MPPTTKEVKSGGRPIRTCTDIEHQKCSQAFLEQSEQREEAALSEAERQKARLKRFLTEVPAIIVVHSRPELVLEKVG